MAFSKTHQRRVTAVKRRRLKLATEAGVDITDKRAVDTFWLERLRRIIYREPREQLR